MRKNFLKFISAFIMILLLLLAGLLVIPHLAGCKTFIVLSGSMEPALPVGSLVYVQTRISPEQIAVNDIITYHAGNDAIAVTHRVVEVNPLGRSWTTQGDANQTTDGPVLFSKLIGRVAFDVPLLGYLVAAIKPHESVLLVGTLIFLIFFVFLPPILKRKTSG